MSGLSPLFGREVPLQIIIHGGLITDSQGNLLQVFELQRL